MVSGSVVLALWVTLFISLFLPVIILIVYALKYKKMGVVSGWFVGAAGFFVTQIVVRVPILSVLGTQQWFIDFANNNYVLYALILGFTAGLFELVGRYAAAKLLSKNQSFERGFAAGLGHGGIEAMVLIGMTYVSNLLYVGMINSGSFDAVVEQTAALGVDTSALLLVKEQLVSASPVLFYCAGYERILTMIGHVAMSLIVFYAVWKKQDVKGILVCLALHTLIDSGSAIIMGLNPQAAGQMTFNGTYAAVYGFLTVMAVIFVVIIVKIKKNWTLKAEA
ncbi:MAG: YhfC family intramembrane metalloprotease [Lachnospiraceae bacterium]|nr:YhfC family intramembrane metalloprotease [Lachnospiraceae bacterium]